MTISANRNVWVSEYKREFTWPKASGRSKSPAPPSRLAITSTTATAIQPLSAVQPPPIDKSTTTINNNSPVVQSFSDQLDDHEQHPSHVYIVERPRTPNLLSYGHGNKTPSNMNNFMKTFNVRGVPEKEIMPETKLKVQQQQQQQEHHHQQQQHYHTHPPASSTSKNNALSFFDKPPRTANIKYSRPMETLSTYSKATQILDKLYDRFQTEYSREFVDWNHEFDAKRRKLARSKIDSATETAAGGALVAAAVPTQTEASRSIVSLKDHFAVEVATKELPPSLQDNLQDHQSITQNTATTTTTAVSAPSPPRLSSRLTKTIASADPDYHEKDDKAVGAEDGFASVESKATSTTTAPHTSFPIVIAGMPSNGTFNYREKKHFPYKKDHLQVQVEQLERELQASAGQAQSLLERASKRRH